MLKSTRRQFLRGTAGVAGAVVVPSWAFTQPDVIANLTPVVTPLSEMSTIGWKAWHTSLILNGTGIIRLDSEALVR